MKTKHFLIAAVLFASCTHIDLGEPQTITHIYHKKGCMCQFDIYGKSSPDDFGNRTKTSISFIDTCAKYEIGDTVKFSPHK